MTAPATSPPKFAPRHPLHGRQRRLVTPEGLALPVTLASRASRVGALVLDFILIHLAMLILTLVLIYLAFGMVGLDFPAADAPDALEFLAVLWIVAMFLFRYGYFLFFELGPRGATPGKRMAGIRVATRDGGRLEVEAVIARNLLRDIELFLPLVFLAGMQDGQSGPAGLAAAAWFAIFALFPFFNRDRLRAGDLIAGTWVIESPRRALADIMPQAGNTSASTTAEPYRFTPSELAVYGEYELQTLERILRDGRKPAMEAVAATISGKIGRQTPGPSDARAFLQAYYTQLREALERNMRFGKRKADKHSTAD